MENIRNIATLLRATIGNLVYRELRKEDSDTKKRLLILYYALHYFNGSCTREDLEKAFEGDR